MMARKFLSKELAFRCGLLFATTLAGYGQTLINLGSQGRNVDFSSAASTRPAKTGPVLPSTCSVGEFFFNSAAPAGQNVYGCTATNVWSLMSPAAGLIDTGANGIVKRTAPNTTVAVPAPTGTIVGTTDTQTLTNKSIDASEINSGTLSPSRLPALSNQTVQNNGTSLTQRSTLNFSGALTGRDNSAAGRTDVDLATVNASVGTFGSTNQIPVITVNSYGQITSVTTSPASAGNTISQMSSGTFSSIPTTCTTGALYFATDQPAGQQIYTCSASNTWTQFLTLGGSGALAFSNGALDVVPSVVPRLSAANTFSGLNTFSNGVQLQSAGAQPSCSAPLRGLFWYLNNGSAKDGVQVCVYNGSSFIWTSLY